jgi:hypothetical protein
MYSAIKRQSGRICVDVDGRLTRRARVGTEQSVTMVFASVAVYSACREVTNPEIAYTIGGSSLNKTFPAPRGGLSMQGIYEAVDLDAIDDHDGRTCVWSKAYGGADNDLPADGYCFDFTLAPPVAPFDCTAVYWPHCYDPLRLYAMAFARQDPYFGTGDFGIMVEVRTQSYDPMTGLVSADGLVLFKGFVAIKLCDALDNTIILPNLLTEMLKDETLADNLYCRGSGGSCALTFNY